MLLAPRDYSTDLILFYNYLKHTLVFSGKTKNLLYLGYLPSHHHEIAFLPLMSQITPPVPFWSSAEDGI